MKLPNADIARVDREKITEYLLNPGHPDNGGKADFFINLGFRKEEWQTFATALCASAQKSSLCQSMESVHGKKYIVDAEIETPIGKTPMVRTIWIVDKGERAPRLVTAYPWEE